MSFYLQNYLKKNKNKKNNKNKKMSIKLKTLIHQENLAKIITKIIYKNKMH